jgi:hypothetical protein
VPVDHAGRKTRLPDAGNRLLGVARDDNFGASRLQCSCALKIPQSCRFGDSDCFVEGAMIAPSINDDVLLKEEQP